MDPGMDNGSTAAVLNITPRAALSSRGKIDPGMDSFDLDEWRVGSQMIWSRICNEEREVLLNISNEWVNPLRKCTTSIYWGLTLHKHRNPE